MPDELDPALLRLFAAANEPLEGRPFSAQLLTSLESRGDGLLGFSRRVMRAVASGLLAGVSAPLALPSTRLLVLSAALVSLLASFA